ncbi:MAG TPA: hypothetical protein VHD60_01090 [Candidatus Saccharimonadales bacterium]|nr:hypothetical protein [Candidatus Saccharimonadales bacterium]
MSTMEQRVSKNEQGFAAIIVTIILLIVLSLITTGFAAQMRKEQRAALDNQLSTQAYYAAESGVNDYAQQIKKYLTNNTPPTEVTALASYFGDINVTSCNGVPGGPVYSGMSVTPLASGVKYTCVLVNATPTALQYGSVGPSSQVIPVTALDSDGNPIKLSKLTISWQPTVNTSGSTPTANCPSSGGIRSFPDANNWSCPFGVLRVDLVPTAGSLFSLPGLQADTMTSYFVPTKAGVAGGSISYTGSAKNQYYFSSANQGAVAAAKCTDGTGGNTASCSMDITGLSQSSYYLRVSSIYYKAAVNVEGFTAGSDSPLELSGAQVLIDSTGLAQDVLRRIQVRIPVNAAAGGDGFNAAIQSSESLCKQFQVAPPAYKANGPDGC